MIISRGEILQTVFGALFRVLSTVSPGKIWVYGGSINYFFLVFQSYFFILSFELPELTKRLIISFSVFLAIWVYDQGSGIQHKWTNHFTKFTHPRIVWYHIL
jgi:hypothetical protein